MEPRAVMPWTCARRSTMQRQMQWIVQQADLRDGDAVARLSYAIEEQGMTAHVVPYVPFGGMDWGFVDPSAPVFVYGSVPMVADAIARCPGAPVAFADPTRLRCSTYYERYAGHVLQARHRFVALGALHREVDVLTRELAVDGVLFVRPDENDKSFDGQLVHREAIDDFMHFASSLVPTDTRCVVASPRSIDEEWRVFVANGHAIAASRYRVRRSSAVEAGAPADVIAFVEARARAWSPHPIFVMDVCRSEDALAIVEIGSASCAGLYACDVRALAHAVRATLAR